MLKNNFLLLTERGKGTVVETQWRRGCLLCGWLGLLGLSRFLGVAHADFGIEGEEGVRPVLCAGLNAFLGKVIVNTLWRWRVVVLNGGWFRFAGQLAL